MQKVLHRLQEQIRDAIRTAVRANTGSSEEVDVALVDYPNHRNHGDHLILTGELQILPSVGLNIRYIADPSRFDADQLRRMLPTGPVLLHGGGSFGDRWTDTQRFRERVIESLPDRPIIQLPQSIEFRDGSESLRRAQRIYRSHPNLTHLIRSHAGVRRTQELFAPNKTMFCPDMALGNRPISLQRQPTVDVLALLRTDSESIRARSSIHSAIPGSLTLEVTDWGLSARRQLAWDALHAPGAVSKRVRGTSDLLYPMQNKAYHMMSRINVRSAIEILSRGSVVVTDRLHAMLLCALMSKPVVALDNANGKVRDIYMDYAGLFENVRMASTAEDMSAHVRELASIQYD